MYLVKLNAKNALQETEKANQQFYFFVSLPPEHANLPLVTDKHIKNYYTGTVWNYKRKALSINK